MTITDNQVNPGRRALADKIRQAIGFNPWPTLIGLFGFLALIWWAIKVGQTAPYLSYPRDFIKYFEGFFPLIFFYLILTRPKIGLIFLVFAISMSPRFTMGKIDATADRARGIDLRLEDYLIPFMYFIWMSRMWIKGKMELRSSRIYLPMTAYTLAITFSTAFGILVGWANLAAGLFFWLKQIEYFALFVLVYNLVDSEDQRRMLIGCFVLTSVLVSVWAIFQGLTGWVISTGITGGRAAMPFDTSPATLGEYYVIIIPLLAVWLLPRSLRQPLRRLAWRGSIVVMAVMGLLFSMSRGSYIGLFLALPAGLLIFFPRSRLSILFLGAFAVMIFLIQPGLEAYYDFLFTVPVWLKLTVGGIYLTGFVIAGILIRNQRALLAVAGLAFFLLIFSPRPLMRVGSVAGELSTTGLGQAKQVAENVAQTEESYHSWNLRVEELWPSILAKAARSPLWGNGITSFNVADNQFLRVLGESGAIGLTCFLWLIWTLLSDFWQGAKSQVWGTRKVLGLSLLLATVGLLLASLSDDAFYPVKVMMNFWFLAGLFFSTDRSAAPAEEA